MAKRTPTPSQTLGPFFAYGLLREDDADVAGPDAAGERIVLAGALKDKNGAPVRDALIEVWQADAAGRMPGRDADADPAVKGFGRTLTKEDGGFSFRTILPGASAGGGNKAQAPHFAIGVFSAGLTRRVLTRVYVPGADGLQDDEIFGALSDAERKSLVAVACDDENGARRLEFQIRLAGDGATTAFVD